MFARLGYTHLDAVLGVKREVMGHDVEGTMLFVTVPCLVSFQHRASIDGSCALHYANSYTAWLS